MKPNPRILVPALAVLVLVLVLVPVLRRAGQRGRLEASGTVEATEAQLGFQAPGRIDSVHVREGDRVAAGAALASLDRVEAAARRAQAAAQLAAARAQLEEMVRGSRPEEVAQARAGARGRAAAAGGRAARLRAHPGAHPEPRGQPAGLRQGEDRASTWRRPRPTRRRSSTGWSWPGRGASASRRRAPRWRRPRRRCARPTRRSPTWSSARPFAGVVTVRHREPGEIVRRRRGGAHADEPRRPLGAHLRARGPHRRGPHSARPPTITTDTFPGTDLPRRGGLHQQRGRVHAQERPDRRGAREAGLRGQGAHHRRPGASSSSPACPPTCGWRWRSDARRRRRRPRPSSWRA